jgi:hypothetical protein
MNSHCRIITNLPIKCPLCGVDLLPMVMHSCAKEDKPVNKKRGQK